MKYLRIVLPFAYCYFLLFFLRNLNAMLAIPLDKELKFSAFSIGLMSGMFLLFTAIAHFPMSRLVDRWNAKMVQIWLLMCAMLGVGIFGASHHVWGLMVGRALMGIGMTGGLLCGMRAFHHWFKNRQIAFLIGVMTISGSVGAVAATIPLQQLLANMHWRAVMMIVGGLVFIGLLAMLILVPHDPKGKKGAGLHFKDLFSYQEYMHNPHLLRVLVPGAFCFGGFISLQSLWLGGWYEGVFGYTSFKSSLYLMIIAFSMMFGILCVPLFKKIAARLKISLRKFQWITYVVYLVFLFLVSLEPFGDHIYGWVVVAFAVQSVFLSYQIVSDKMKQKDVAKAMSFFYIVILFVAFVLQVLFGLIVSFWKQSNEAFYPVIAYQVAYWVMIILSIGSLWWAKEKRFEK